MTAGPSATDIPPESDSCSVDRIQQILSNDVLLQNGQPSHDIREPSSSYVINERRRASESSDRTVKSPAPLKSITGADGNEHPCTIRSKGIEMPPFDINSVRHYDLMDIYRNELIAIRKFNLHISGIEVTQSIQHYRSAQHLTDTADIEPDNAIRLVAGKPAWVRVYLGSIFGTSGVSGTLEVQRRYSGFLFSTVTTLTPLTPATVTVPGDFEYDYVTNRSTLGSTLNFVIPSEEMIGTLRLIARVSNGLTADDHTITVSVTLRQTLRLAGVMISYNGPASNAPGAPNLTIAAPTLSDLQAMSGTALTLFPVRSVADFRMAGTLALTFPLIDPGPFPTSGCGASWDNLHAQVANARAADGNRQGWIYYGLLPNGVPIGMVGGCGGGGVAVGPIGQPDTLAHEAGHAAGLAHAPAGNAPNPDPNYPAYEPYDTPANRRASIGEYGLDVNNGNISSPQTFRDLMAYGSPRWISLYHYRRLLENASLNPVTVGVDYPWWKDLVWQEYREWRIPIPPYEVELELPMFPPPKPPENVISLIVRIEHGKVAEVTHVARTRMYTQLTQIDSTPFTAQLRDGRGEVLAEAPLLRLVGDACGCAQGSPTGEYPSHYLAQALVPDVADGESLSIVLGGEIAWERTAPDEPIHVEGFRASASARNGLRIAWSTRGKATENWLRWSVDGEEWHVLATGLKGQEALVAPSQLPSGSVLLQLVAHDGFFSHASEPIEVRLPEHKPEVAILHPKDGYTYTAGQPLRLWGSVSSFRGDEIPPERCVWLLDGRELARGLDTWITLESGSHKLAFRVESEAGSTEAAVSVTCTG